MKKLLATLCISAISFGATARTAQGLKIYINPGHGGHDANDRNVVIPPYAAGDPNGYWESNSNLSKGLQLRDMLLAKGYQVQMSRVTNTSDDDLGLSKIAQLSTESGADLFISIHSNATGTPSRVNFPLMLFRGYDSDPEKPAAKEFCTILNKYLLENQATVWTHPNPNIRGDWSFYPSWGTQGLGVLRDNGITCMLSEGSYHDYIPEAYRLMSDDYCWLEAYHFRQAIDEFFGVDAETTGVIAGRINDNRFPRGGDFATFGDDKLATIDNAVVTLYDANGDKVAGYTTDAVNLNGFFLFKDVQPGNYKIEVAESDTHFSESCNVTVSADNISYANMLLQRKRLTPPQVTAYSPVWAEGDPLMLCNVPVTISFNWDMDTQATEKAFTISPAVEGKISWEDLNTKMVFTPTTPYQTGTEYTVTLSTEAAHADGMTMVEPLSFRFCTNDRDYMGILSHYPSDNAQVHYSGAAIEFRFDKKPNTTKLFNNLSCVDSNGNDVSFYKRGLKSSTTKDVYGFFRVPFTGNLTVGETYTLTLGGPLADRDGITIGDNVKVTFTAVDATHTNESATEVDNMSGNNFAYSAEGSIGVTTATIKASTTQKLFDKAQEIAYTFSDDEQCEAYFTRQPADTDAIINTGDKLGVHVYGDLTGNEIYLELTSDVSSRYQPICTMDFLGWKYIEIPVTEAEAPSRLTGLKLVEVPSQMSKTGTAFIDRITVGEDAGVDDAVMSQISVYPNPASQYLIANAPAFITSVSLIDLNGRTLTTVGGNVINVSAVPSGNYLMRVNTQGSSTIHKVVIRH